MTEYTILRFNKNGTDGKSTAVKHGSAKLSADFTSWEISIDQLPGILSMRPENGKDEYDLTSESGAVIGTAKPSRKKTGWTLNIPVLGISYFLSNRVEKPE